MSFWVYWIVLASFGLFLVVLGQFRSPFKSLDLLLDCFGLFWVFWARFVSVYLSFWVEPFWLILHRCGSAYVFFWSFAMLCVALFFFHSFFCQFRSHFTSFWLIVSHCGSV